MRLLIAMFPPSKTHTGLLNWISILFDFTLETFESIGAGVVG